MFIVKEYPGAVTGGKHWKYLLLKYLYFLGPKGPRCLFSLMHISILVTSSKQKNAAAAALLFSLLLSRVHLSQALKGAAPGRNHFPWALGAEGLRTCYRDELRGAVGDCRAAYFNMNATDKSKEDSTKVNCPNWDCNLEIMRSINAGI